MKSFGEYLRQKRIKAKLTQGKVALSLGYKTPQFVSNWERGLASPPLDKISRLVQLYKLDPEEIIGLLMNEQEQILRHALSTRSKQKGAL